MRNFNPRSPCGERLDCLRSRPPTSEEFQSTLPVWGATSSATPGSLSASISIHAPRVGSDSPVTTSTGCSPDFNPRSPCGERRGEHHIPRHPALDFNPRSPCGERPGPRLRHDGGRPIFQSTLPVWGATSSSLPFRPRPPISIHAPRVGSDVRDYFKLQRHYKFQSTLPVWGATPSSLTALLLRSYFNPRSPCGERLVHAPIVLSIQAISIHAPRVGSDGEHHLPRHPAPDFNPRSPCGERPQKNPDFGMSILFQSTLPVWGATIGDRAAVVVVAISIHAPRVGSDVDSVPTAFYKIRDFNPRSPCGERPVILQRERARKVEFQSTLPVWGATGAVSPQLLIGTISIHAPRVGSDGGDPLKILGSQRHFNPRSPCGERPSPISIPLSSRNFNPRSPCGERPHPGAK